MLPNDFDLDSQPHAVEDPQPTDHYPNVYDVLTALQASGELPNGPIERLELTALASGEATYRIWAPRAEESEGGYLREI